MSARCTISICLLVILPFIAYSAAPVIEPTGVWSGKVKNESLRKLAPQSGFITDAENWKKLWTAWQPNEEIPKINFDKEFILIGSVPGPNSVVMQPTIDNKGHVKFIIGGTKIGGPGFGYKLMKIPKQGVATVNGNAINSVKLVLDHPVQNRTGREKSRIRFHTKDDTTFVDIESKFGIDQVVIKRESMHWPKSLHVHLHLSGLESFNVSNGEITVKWSVNSNGNNMQSVLLHKSGKETQLNENSPFYSTVRIVGGKGKIPLKEGYFEVVLPAKLFAKNPEKITLNWVDFYRN